MKKLLIFTALITLSICVKAQDIKGNYAIKNVKTGMLLRIKDASSKNGTPLVAYYPENWKCMTWNFKSTGGNSYQLRNLFTNKTFQPVTDAAVDVAFHQQPLVANDAGQQYEFVKVKKDTYLIKVKGTELYITPSDEKGAVNSSIVMAARRVSDDLQLWTIYEQSPIM